MVFSCLWLFPSVPTEIMIQVIGLNGRSPVAKPLAGQPVLFKSPPNALQQSFMKTFQFPVSIFLLAALTASARCETTELLQSSNPIRFSSSWTGSPNSVTNRAEISNDTNNFKTLMIVGNKSAGLGRRVSIWDRLEVNGILTTTGNIGIATSNPQAKLDVGANVSNGGLGTVFGRLPEGNTTGAGTYLGVRGYGTQVHEFNGKSFALEHRFYGHVNSSIDFYRGGGMTGGFMSFTTGNGNERMRIDGAGKVGIGTLAPQNKLDVNGTIRAKEVIVETGWADYVFQPEYQLMPLSGVEQHIMEYGHLPGMPSAAEVSQSGVSLGDAQRLLLEKIEELTLHMIKQEKRLAAIESENAELKAALRAAR